jgi:hypothetical protein
MQPFDPSDIPDKLARWLPIGSTLAFPKQGMTSIVAFPDPGLAVFKRCIDPQYRDWLRREHEVLVACRARTSQPLGSSTAFVAPCEGGLLFLSSVAREHGKNPGTSRHVNMHVLAASGLTRLVWAGISNQLRSGVTVMNARMQVQVMKALQHQLSSLPCPVPAKGR